MAHAAPYAELSAGIIGAAIEVHRTLGPGLLESVYEECMSFELTARGLLHARQVPIPVIYKDHRLTVQHRLDLVVDGRVVVELKAVEHLMPIHLAQLMTALRLTGLPIGLLINFNVPVLVKGIKRVANGRDLALPRPPHSPPP
ncbi:MAG TPA: GxxExxY protein [Gemmatimonadales bacterium]|jgi:GxxExxY protein|nr:GxxExxY protein [Gemmatimonadales bacterium]